MLRITIKYLPYINIMLLKRAMLTWTKQFYYRTSSDKNKRLIIQILHVHVQTFSLYSYNVVILAYIFFLLPFLPPLVRRLFLPTAIMEIFNKKEVAREFWEKYAVYSVWASPFITTPV